MPALQNPTDLLDGNPATLRVPSDTPLSLTVSPQWDLTVLHSGVDEDGNEDRNPVYIGVNATANESGPGSQRTVLIPGAAITFARDITRSLSFFSPSGAPLINVFSNKSF